MHEHWKDKRVLVTGAAGFIGSHVVRELVTRGARVTATFTSTVAASRLLPFGFDISTIQADLCNPGDAERACSGQEIVINVAHMDGSLAFKRSRPAFLFRRNMLISLNMLEAACSQRVQRFLMTSSAEVYPLDAPFPTVEQSVVTAGQFDRPYDGYVWSKRMSELATTLFAHEYGLTILIARPTNVYGPGDDFDDSRGRVIPSFIRRALHDEPITIWGDGEQIRSFLFVEDLARGLVDFAAQGSAKDIVNFAGEEISIKQLAETVIRLTGSKSSVVCELDKPAGATKRVLDGRVAARLFGFKPSVRLEDGVERTLQAYRSMSVQAAAL